MTGFWTEFSLVSSVRLDPSSFETDWPATFRKHSTYGLLMQAANSLALGTSPIVRALVDPEGGMRSVRALDNVSFTDWFKSHGGSEGSIRRMWDPIAYALGFLNCDQVWLCNSIPP